MGASPQPPGVLRMGPMERRRGGPRGKSSRHAIQKPRGSFGEIRRSGCSPAEPYPADNRRGSQAVLEAAMRIKRRQRKIQIQDPFLTFIDISCWTYNRPLTNKKV